MGRGGQGWRDGGQGSKEGGKDGERVGRDGRAGNKDGKGWDGKEKPAVQASFSIPKTSQELGTLINDGTNEFVFA